MWYSANSAAVDIRQCRGAFRNLSCLDDNRFHNVCETCCYKRVTNAILIYAHTPCSICTARWQRVAWGQCCAHHHRLHAEVCGTGAVFFCTAESPVHHSGQEGSECHSLFLTQVVAIWYQRWTFADVFYVYLFLVFVYFLSFELTFLQGQDYEVRTYQTTKYMSTTVSGTQWDSSQTTGFRRLFSYIQGNNKSSEFHLHWSANATLDF